jgi:conjugal transfer/entry exclusion protein
MDIFPAGANTIINIFFICVVILVIMFTMSKITFKQLLLICLGLIIVAMVYLKYTQPKQSAEDTQLSNMIKNFSPHESATTVTP